MLRPVLTSLLVLAALVAPGAQAASRHFTTPELLRAFFPHSEKVTFKKHVLTSAQRQKLVERLGYAPKKAEYVIFQAQTAGRVDGYAIIDDELGQHEPITFAVKLSPTGVIERQEVMVYREAYGEEIVDPRFRRQFEGKTARDPIRAGVDLDVVTGATISCRAMAVGVRRAVALVDELVVRPATIQARTVPAEG